MTDPWQNCNLLSLNEGNFWNNWIKGCFARSREDKSTNIFQTRFFLPAPFWCLLILYGGMLQRYCLIAKAPYNVSQLLAALTLKLLQNNVRGMEIQWNTFFLEYIIHLFCLSWQYSWVFSSINNRLRLTRKHSWKHRICRLRKLLFKTTSPCFLWKHKS